MPMKAPPSRQVLLQAESAADARHVNRGSGKIVKGIVGDADDVVFDEVGDFARAVHGLLEAAFPTSSPADSLDQRLHAFRLHAAPSEAYRGRCATCNSISACFCR